MKNITISCVGDISFNGRYDTLLATRGTEFPFQEVRNIFSQSDLVIGNLESPLVEDSVLPAFPLKTPLRGHPGYAEGLKWAGFDIMNLSNNHILDYGEEGVNSTQRILGKHGIRYFGYGRNIEAARKLKIETVNYVKVGFLGYTDVVIDSPFYADKGNKGIAKFDIKAAETDVIESKKLVDILIINIHWGIEYFHLPNPQQMTQARRLIDSGADIIIGHHPHLLQGIEIYKNGVIAYSLGNFIFSEIIWKWQNTNGDERTTYYKFKRRHRQSIILDVTVNSAGDCDCRVKGTYLSNSGQIISDLKAEERIKYLSSLLSRQDYPEYFNREFKQFVTRTKMINFFRRLKRFYKIRPKHIAELRKLIWK